MKLLLNQKTNKNFKFIYLGSLDKAKNNLDTKSPTNHELSGLKNILVKNNPKAQVHLKKCEVKANISKSIDGLRTSILSPKERKMAETELKKSGKISSPKLAKKITQAKKLQQTAKIEPEKISGFAKVAQMLKGQFGQRPKLQANLESTQQASIDQLGTFPGDTFSA